MGQARVPHSGSKRAPPVKAHRGMREGRELLPDWSVWPSTSARSLTTVRLRSDLTLDCAVTELLTAPDSDADALSCHNWRSTTLTLSHRSPPFSFLSLPCPPLNPLSLLPRLPICPLLLMVLPLPTLSSSHRSELDSSRATAAMTRTTRERPLYTKQCRPCWTRRLPLASRTIGATGSAACRLLSRRTPPRLVVPRPLQ